jgi:4-amino-4-deoxy-L-arabinose transferase-like glycosyltransferase
MQTPSTPRPGPSRAGWAFLLLAVLTAVFLRFYQLGQYPPGLYRDEAYNGLDALDVLAGQHALFFPNNNGREPAYIYLTAAAIALFGPSALAVRLGAALAGSLATIPVYLLGQAWFGRRVGLLAAWLWAVTLWSVHLGRIGLRVSLLAPLLALTFWLGTLAYRRQHNGLWLAAGLVYGASFYTYLAARFTPLVLLALFIYLLWQGRGRRLWPGLAWFGLGTAVTFFPLALFLLQEPSLILGRSSQVSILNPAIHGGDFWGALAGQVGRALGMFVWRGDDILRHNPAGRPVFDWLMAGPFLLGVGWCVRRWRRPAAMTTLLWVGIMLGPTILAEDTPHFLRAAGVLPAALLLPALGLVWLWDWASAPKMVRRGVVVGLLVGSLLLAGRDYVRYVQQPDVAFLFETAVSDMAAQINAEASDTAIFVDDARYWQKYPTLPFLVPAEQVRPYQSDNLPPLPVPAAVYAWPYEGLTAVRAAITPPALVTIEWGSLARGDLEAAAYPLVVRYGLEPPPDWPPLASFGETLRLHQVVVMPLLSGDWQVDVYWSGATAVSPDLVAFVHAVGPEGLLAQSDSLPGAADWPSTPVWGSDWWAPGLMLRDRRILPAPPGGFDAAVQLHVGWYDPATQTRLPVTDALGRPLGDVFVWP